MNKGTSRREGGIAGTHRNADCLLKNTSTKHRKYFVDQKLKNFDEYQFQTFLIGSECFFFSQNKFLRQSILLSWQFIFIKHSWTNSFNLSFSFEWGIVV